MKWITSYSKIPIKYINIGNPAYYLGWKKPRKNEQYVTLANNGTIAATYRFVNGDWRGKGANGKEYFLADNTYTTNTVEFTRNYNGTISITTNSQSYNVSTTISHTNVKYTCTVDKFSSDYLCKLNLIAAPSTNYIVDYWTENGSVIPNSHDVNSMTVDITENKIYSVMFKDNTAPVVPDIEATFTIQYPEIWGYLPDENITLVLEDTKGNVLEDWKYTVEDKEYRKLIYITIDETNISDLGLFIITIDNKYKVGTWYVNGNEIISDTQSLEDLTFSKYIDWEQPEELQSYIKIEKTES